MDILFTAFLATLGLVSFIVVTLTSRVGVGLALFSWASVLWLSVYVMIQLSKTDAESIMVWTDTAEMGELTIILTVTGMSLLACTDRREKHASSDRRS